MWSYLDELSCSLSSCEALSLADLGIRRLNSLLGKWIFASLVLPGRTRLKARCRLWALLIEGDGLRSKPLLADVLVLCFQGLCDDLSIQVLHRSFFHFDWLLSCGFESVDKSLAPPSTVTMLEAGSGMLVGGEAYLVYLWT